MGKAMAALNGYKPEQSSDLYITDGDQIDWMYGVHRIFSFTWELYPPETVDRLGRPLPARREDRPADGPQPERPALPHRHRRLPVPGDRAGEDALRRRSTTTSRSTAAWPIEPVRDGHGDRRPVGAARSRADVDRAASRSSSGTTVVRARRRWSPAGRRARARTSTTSTAARRRSGRPRSSCRPQVGSLTFRYYFAHGSNSSTRRLVHGLDRGRRNAARGSSATLGAERYPVRRMDEGSACRSRNGPARRSGSSSRRPTAAPTASSRPESTTSGSRCR